MLIISIVFIMVFKEERKGKTREECVCKGASPRALREGSFFAYFFS